MTKKKVKARKPRPSEILVGKPDLSMLPAEPSIAKMGKPPTDAKVEPGRPRGGFSARYTLRITPAHQVAFANAAREAQKKHPDLKMQDWARNVLEKASGMSK